MECPPIPKMSYAQFGERLNRQVISDRIPISGSIELTFRCNFKCDHCYCNLPLNDQEAIERELETEDICRILDQIADAGCLWLLITGGEFFLGREFFEIYTRTPVEVCMERDIKGMYKKALAGKISNFTGVDDPYEEPIDPELALDTDKESIEESVGKVLDKLAEMGYIE